MYSSYIDLHFNHKQNQIPPDPSALPVVFPAVDISIICNILLNLNSRIIIEMSIINIYVTLNTICPTLCTLYKNYLILNNFIKWLLILWVKKLRRGRLNWLAMNICIVTVSFIVQKHYVFTLIFWESVFRLQFWIYSSFFLYLSIELLLNNY